MEMDKEGLMKAILSSRNPAKQLEAFSCDRGLVCLKGWDFDTARLLFYPELSVR
jgi:hypothetical protein